jgi:hypothetical protein
LVKHLLVMRAHIGQLNAFVYVVSDGHLLPQQWTGYGTYLARGLVITAAHVVGSASQKIFVRPNAPDAESEPKDIAKYFVPPSQTKKGATVCRAVKVGNPQLKRIFRGLPASLSFVECSWSTFCDRYPRS